MKLDRRPYFAVGWLHPGRWGPRQLLALRRGLKSQLQEPRRQGRNSVLRLQAYLNLIHVDQELSAHQIVHREDYKFQT